MVYLSGNVFFKLLVLCSSCGNRMGDGKFLLWFNKGCKVKRCLISTNYKLDVDSKVTYCRARFVSPEATQKAINRNKRLESGNTTFVVKKLLPKQLISNG